MPHEPLAPDWHGIADSVKASLVVALQPHSFDELVTRVFRGRLVRNETPSRHRPSSSSPIVASLLPTDLGPLPMQNTVLRPLYYPHTAVADPQFIAQSLLLWDGVRCINPFQDRVHRGLMTAPAPYAAALRRYNTEHVLRIKPDDYDRHRLEELLRDDFSRPVPANLDPKNAPAEDTVLVHSGKMALGTLRGMIQNGWACPDDDDDFFAARMHVVTAVKVLHQLAQVLTAATAGATVTDSRTALVEQIGLNYLRVPTAGVGNQFADLDLEPAHDGPHQRIFVPTQSACQLVLELALQLPGFSSRDLTPRRLEQLMDLHAEPESLEFRRAFTSKVESLASGLHSDRVDRRDALRLLLTELEKDRILLSRHLRSAGLEEATTPALVTALLAVGATYLHSPVADLAAVIGGVASVPQGLLKWRSASSDIRGRHWTAWLTKQPAAKEQRLRHFFANSKNILGDSGQLALELGDARE